MSMSEATLNRTESPPIQAPGECLGRRILCVFPRYAPSFGSFEFSYPLTDGVRAFMPPQGLLVIAAVLPSTWQVRFIDENIAAATRADFAWADAVFVSGMHVQRRQMDDIRRRAQALDKVTVLGGSSVSACPEHYPDFDYLHVGELGDATDELIARLTEDVTRPERQVVLTTRERRELTEFPLPAYELAQLGRYFIGSIQFSSGCPYQCEFCDIPALYGRNPRFKTSEQVCAELDKMLACGLKGAVYFVDDNFIAHKRAVRELLPHLIEWQQRNGYPFLMACEATLNIAKRPEILTLMRDAYFCTVFCGIETTDPAALEAISKEHNMMVPIAEAVHTLNSYGMEVVSGIILGLDTDTLDSGKRLLEFVELSQIPLLTMNLLQALPRTPLWDRLKRENRLLADEEGRESNVAFHLPYEQVLAMWRDAMRVAYQPEKLFARYEYQTRATFPNRFKVPNSPQRVSWPNIKRGLIMLARIFWFVGLRGDYRRVFWRFAWARLKRGEIEHLIAVSLVAHHLILFAREASSGTRNASHYSFRPDKALVPAE
jgi:hopanoid C-2 methylase